MTRPPTRLVLSRHGQTVWHGENRYAGVSDVDLTELGRVQADRLARWAKHNRPDAVVSSPIRRAVETATPSAQALGLPVAVDDDLREVNFGIAEGQTLGELRAADPHVVARFQHDPVTNHFPGGEPAAAAAERAERALRRVAAGHPGATVLVVAHNTLIRLALCRLLGIDVRRYRQTFPRLENGALTEVSLADSAGPAALLSYNVPLTSRPGFR